MEGVIFEQNFFCDIFLYWYLAHKKWVLLSKFQNLLFMNTHRQTDRQTHIQNIVWIRLVDSDSQENKTIVKNICSWVQLRLMRMKLCTYWYLDPSKKWCNDVQWIWLKHFPFQIEVLWLFYMFAIVQWNLIWKSDPDHAFSVYLSVKCGHSDLSSSLIIVT